MSRLLPFPLVVILSGLLTATQAQVQHPAPRLVANLNTQIAGGSSEPMHFRDMDGQLAFSVFDNIPSMGPQVWLSDGSAANTRPAVNQAPESVATWDPRTWVKVARGWVFGSARPDGGIRLWIHQELGTNFSMTGEIASFPALPQNLTADGFFAYFTVDHGAPIGTVLWRSDGSIAGTIPLHVAAPGSTEPGNGFSNISLLTPSLDGVGLWFVADHTKLFRTAGTPETTVEVDYTAQFPAGGIHSIVAGGSGIFFACDSDERFLAKTDGTPAGTVKIGGGDGSAPNLWRDPHSLYYWNGALYFNAFTEAQRTQLYRSDGSAAGTSIIKVMKRSLSEGTPEILGSNASVIFVEADDGKQGRNLYRTDGTAKGTTVIRPLGKGREGIPTGHSDMINGKLWFSPFNQGRRALWVSDGNPKGTRMVKSFTMGGRNSEAGIQQIGGAGGICYLSANDGVHGMELWKSDGSAKGTVMVKDIAAAELGSIQEAVDVAVLDGNYYFTAGTRSGETQLWRSDGTTQGTVMFRNFGKQAWPYNLSAAAGRLNTFVYYLKGNREQAWSTDGTAKGTQKEQEFPLPPRQERMAEAGNKAIAVIEKKPYVLRPGHPEGPLLLAAPGEIPDAYDRPNPLAEMNGRVYFPAAGDGPALWSTDGSTAGTFRVAQMEGSSSSYNMPFDVTELDGSIYFLNRDIYDVNLWKSDGSKAGTTIVEELGFGQGNWLRMEGCAGKLYILGRAPNGEMRLLVREGEGAPVPVKSFPGTTENSFRHLFEASGDLLYFSFDDPVHGLELWRSDGTTEGTFMVKDIYPGSGWGSPMYLVNAGPWTYFAADDDVHGFELWRTDGTTANTAMLADMVAGPVDSWPQGLRRLGDRILFNALSDKGRELWAIDNASAAPASPAHAPLMAQTAGIGAGGEGEDPDALLRHAFNVTQPGDTTPLTPGSGVAGYPAIGTTGQVLRVEYLRRKDGSLIYTPQYSGSLAPGSFQTMRGTITVTDIDAVWERVIAEQPYDPATTPRLFARVEVRTR